MKDDKLFLIHILECLEKIEAYIRDGKEVFGGSTMVQDAVIRNFEVIGEATNRKAQAQEPYGLSDVFLNFSE